MPLSLLSRAAVALPVRAKARGPSFSTPRCGLCTLSCEDKHTDCPAWAEAKNGKGCTDDSDYMHENCPFSCGTCAKLPVHAPKDKAEL